MGGVWFWRPWSWLCRMLVLQSLLSTMFSFLVFLVDPFMKSILLPYDWYSRWNNPLWLTHPSLYCTLLLCVQGPVYVRQALCHWATSSAFKVFTLVQSLAQLPRLDLDLWPSWFSSPWDHRRVPPHGLSTSFLQWDLWNLLSVILKHSRHYCWLQLLAV